MEREQLNEHWDDVAADWEDMARAAAYILQAEGLRAMKLAKDLRDNYGVLKLNMSPSQKMLFSALVDID
ncbi:hypothetical protein BSU04_25950 [Caballeronia sordidicola]|uniref:Uncharacterized protein n=1 Tax=Caballeronia sordidicola TaxID=196367 RepID=A0A226WY15_CABSO|nr:hypothetical protein BSU04_25950 [Caballeronia sordidicola]